MSSATTASRFMCAVFRSSPSFGGRGSSLTPSTPFAGGSLSEGAELASGAAVNLSSG